MAITRRARGGGRSSGRGGGDGGSGDENPNIAEMIAQQLAALIPTIVTQVASAMASGNGGGAVGGSGADVNGGSGADGGNGVSGGNNNGNRNGCTYKEFTACNPKEFDGKDGTLAYTQWIEKMEAVIDISNCAADKRIKYVAGSLTDKALTWWNLQIQARGREAAMGMSWEEFKALMQREFCPGNEMQRLENEFWNHTMVGADHAAYTDRFHELAKLVPHLVTPESQRIQRYMYGLVPQIRGTIKATEPPTLQSAILKAGALTDEMVRNGSLVRSGEKRKETDESSKQGNARTDNKKARGGKVFVTANTEKKVYGGPHPKCDKCNYHHQPTIPCRVCARCNRLGHYARDCRVGVKQVTPLNVVHPRACYECGSLDHLRYACPQLNKTPGQGGNNPNQILAIEGNNNRGANTRGQVFAIGVNEVHQNANV